MGNKERSIPSMINKVTSRGPVFLVWLNGVPQGSILVFYVLYYCGESFLQKIAARQDYSATRCKLVELLFSAKAFPTKRILVLKWLTSLLLFSFVKRQ